MRASRPLPADSSSLPAFDPRPGQRPGLYLHVPFCSSICPYCDFAVLRDGKAARSRFVANLLQEVDAWGGGGGGFDTLYLGGGTPSLLERSQLETILEAVRRNLGMGPDAFVVLEANPEDVTRESAQSWRALGVNGVSLGVQSFRPGVLRFLGRKHDPRRAREAVIELLDTGFEWISIDLIYGLPARLESSGPSFEADLAEAIALEPHHLSCYQLTVHSGTPFDRLRSRGGLVELGADDQAEALVLTHEILAEAGYQAYEVSSFARETEYRSRHNQKYWDHTPYLGLGPSAHSFDGVRRWWNERSLDAWESRLLAGLRPIGGKETLSASDLALEAVMFGLRTAGGLDLDSLASDFGIDLLALNEARVERYSSEGLLVISEGLLRPTRRGMAVADGLAASLRLEPGG